jgi:aspartyl-tRNA(Asn)/glutamyl-tRNA(Gln) amidotransferase subunit A
MAVGTDTAGSIRVPAACCGIVGFKPSYDAVPRAGVLDLAPSLDHVGPIGASVADCAALFAAMLDMPAVPRWTYENLAQRGVARLGGYFEQPLDEEVRRALDAAARALARDGARCSERTIEGVELAPAIQLNTICAEATAVHEERLRTRAAEIGEDVRVRLEMGHFIPGHWYVKAQRLRQALVAHIDAAFENVDALLCATLRAPAPPVGQGRVRIGGRDYALHTAVTNLTLPFNLAGLPAASIPWTLSTDGVPICVQVVGARGRDWRTLAIAQRLELASPWFKRRPAGT